MASKASTRLLRVLKTDDPDFRTEWAAVCSRSPRPDADVDCEVHAVIARVREAGDRELLDAVEANQQACLTRLEVTRDEWDAGCEAVDPTDRAAIGKAAMRIRDFHRKRIPSSWEMREEGGAYMGQRVRPLSRVGLFVPGGEDVNPSSVIMHAVPPSVVEVPEIVMTAPPRPDGTVRPEVLMGARVAGVHRVFKVGGAHAIAALAYGTESIPRVDKIIGSGDAHAAAAKRLVHGAVAVDADSGPSELCTVADKTATPAWLAADIVAHAESDESAQVVLITHYKGIASRTQDQISKQIKSLGRSKIARRALSTRGVVVLTKNLAESLVLADQYAPEHLVLAVENPEATAKSVLNAGSILLGHYTPVSVGTYLAGPNHVLPTGGAARFFSPLGVEDFLKRTSFIKFEPPKLRELGAEVIRLSQVEQLTGHGTSVDLRLQKIRRARREREAAREAEL